MVNIAICDDNVLFCTELKQYMQRKFPGHINKISCYNSGLQLINDIKDYNMTFDILFLDIDMPELSGVDTANELRKLDGHHDAVLFFITSYDTPAKSIVNLHPFAYISKPIDYEYFDSQFVSAIDLLFKSDNLVSFNKKNIHLVLDYRRIMYISSENRGATFYLTNGISKISMSISDIEIILISRPTFIRIHTSHILNIKYLNKVTPSYVELTNGIKLPISRKYKDDLLLRLNRIFPI